MEFARTSIIHGGSPFSVAVCGPARCASAQPLAPCLLSGDLAHTALDGGGWRCIGVPGVGLLCLCSRFVREQALRPCIPCDVMFDESVPFHRLFSYLFAPPPPPLLFLAPDPPPVDPLSSQGPTPSGVSQVDPLPNTVPVEVAGDSAATRGGAEPRGAEPAGVEPRVAEPEGVEPGGADGTMPIEVAGDSGAAGTGGVGGAGAGDPTETGAVGAGGIGAGGTGAGGAGAGGAGAGGTGVGGVRAGEARVVDPGARGAGAGGAAGTGDGGTVRPRPYFVPLLQQVLGVPSSTSLTPPLLCPQPDQSQAPLQLAS
ncbi:unnamed protein product [Closterium sp. NIES-54]